MGRAARVWAALMVPFWTVLPGMGLIDLQVMFVENTYYADSVGLMVSWGVFFTILLGVPFGWVAGRPTQALPLVALIGICVVAALVGAVLGLQWQAAGVALLIAAAALPLIPAARRQLSPTALRLGVRPNVLALAAVMTPFAVTYAPMRSAWPATSPRRNRGRRTVSTTGRSKVLSRSPSSRSSS